jgi:hypothetical protein
MPDKSTVNPPNPRGLGIFGRSLLFQRRTSDAGDNKVLHDNDSFTRLDLVDAWCPFGRDNVDPGVDALGPGVSYPLVGARTLSASTTFCEVGRNRIRARARALAAPVHQRICGSSNRNAHHATLALDGKGQVGADVFTGRLRKIGCQTLRVAKSMRGSMTM